MQFIATQPQTLNPSNSIDLSKIEQSEAISYIQHV